MLARFGAVTLADYRETFAGPNDAVTLVRGEIDAEEARRLLAELPSEEALMPPPDSRTDAQAHEAGDRPAADAGEGGTVTMRIGAAPATTTGSQEHEATERVHRGGVVESSTAPELEAEGLPRRQWGLPAAAVSVVLAGIAALVLWPTPDDGANAPRAAGGAAVVEGAALDDDAPPPVPVSAIVAPMEAPETVESPSFSPAPEPRVPTKKRATRERTPSLPRAQGASPSPPDPTAQEPSPLGDPKREPEPVMAEPVEAPPPPRPSAPRTKTRAELDAKVRALGLARCTVPPSVVAKLVALPPAGDAKLSGELDARLDALKAACARP
jgi:hypothetical protein